MKTTSDATVPARKRNVVESALVAGLLSGIPSTGHALLTRRDPLEATKAAGTLVLHDSAGTLALVGAGIASHALISLAWASVLTATLPRDRSVAWGAVSGACIAVLDLLILGRRFERIRRLPLGPQIADHIAFGTIVGFMLSRPGDR